MICPRLDLVKIWHERSEGSERRREREKEKDRTRRREDTSSEDEDGKSGLVCGMENVGAECTPSTEPVWPKAWHPSAYQLPGTTQHQHTVIGQKRGGRADYPTLTSPLAANPATTAAAGGKSG